MIAAHTKGRRSLLIGFCLLIVSVSVILNVPSLFFEPVHLWFRVALPTVLCLGFVGSIWRVNFLRIVGWIGVAWFTLLVIGTTFPGDDYLSGGPEGPSLTAPRFVSERYIEWRFLLLMVLAVVLAILFQRLGKVSAKNEASGQET
jgi:hypothetical protein